MPAWLSQLWFDDQAQDVTEYAIMLTIAIVLVVGTVRLLGASANERVFVSRKCDPVKSIFSGRSAKYICNRE